MGPYLLIDKSTIQGLNPEECVLLSRYYTHIMSPILVREFTSFLAKPDHDLEELKQDVKRLAEKSNFGPTHLLPNAVRMAYNNLLGVFVPMNGQIPFDVGTKCIAEDGSIGWQLNDPPEIQMLRNWSNGIFDETQIEQANTIRAIDSNIAFEDLYNALDTQLKNLQKPSSLDSLVQLVDAYLTSLKPNNLLFEAADFILDPERLHIMEREWKIRGCPALKEFAPYSYYYYRVNLIYILGTHFDLIKRGKHAKTHLDMQYLYYLPFAMVFTSNDNELIKVTQFFLRNDQTFISLKELKNDFKLMQDFFNLLSKEQKTKFYEEYGIYPPELENCITTQIWIKKCRPRPPNAGAKPSPEEEKKILKLLEMYRQAKPFTS